MNPQDQNNQPPQSIPQPQQLPPQQPFATPQLQPQQQIPQAKDPGETMGIIALIAAFIIPPAGLILGIIGRSQSKKAGHNNGLALAATIISAIVMVFWVLYFLFVIFVLAAVTSTVDNGFDTFDNVIEQAEAEAGVNNNDLEQINQSTAVDPSAPDTSSQAYLDWLEVVRTAGYGGDFINLRHVADDTQYADQLLVQKPLDTIAVYAVNNPTVTLHVIGAINDVNSSVDGTVLSGQRARYTAQELVSRGVSSDQIKLYAAGDYSEIFGFTAATDEIARVSVITITPPTTGTPEPGL